MVARVMVGLQLLFFVRGKILDCGGDSNLAKIQNHVGTSSTLNNTQHYLSRVSWPKHLGLNIDTKPQGYPAVP